MAVVEADKGVDPRLQVQVALLGLCMDLPTALVLHGVLPYILVA
jgi:hypothetical protein